MFASRIKLFRPADILFWLMLLVGAYFLQSFVISHSGANSVALIEIDGQVNYRIDLQKEQKYLLKEYDPPVTVRVEGNKIAVTQNDCPNKICMKMGPISRAGQMIVCVPKKLLIYIPVQSESQETVKAITG